MPELPEVECVIRALKPNLIGQKIEDIDVRYDRMILEDVSSFKSNLINHTFVDIKRRGKFIIFCLNDDTYLVSHLRMEGKLFLEEKNSMDNKHIHVIIHLSDYDLYYQDVRKFGIMVTKTKDTLFTTEPLNHLGKDPIEGVDNNIIFDKIHKKRIPIKESLLDQSIMSGLGNIYVDEVLFTSHVSPYRPSNMVTKEEIDCIIEESRKIFLKSIELGGSTIKSFTSSKNHAGSFQDYLKVHTKNVCPVCGQKLLYEKLGGRGTYYCNKCQH
ncbi:MAG: DNA-formamidopyrimidine glycosylase [Acholeplasmatales bacterium]|nr:DNA-formamidopyrimidine glycosylase [Acholeplasmatales bacterium]